MKDQKHIYLIPGMGADHRIFSNLTFSRDYAVHHLPWLTPLKTESVEQYATRMAASITGPAPVLLGVSFGGMISVEIAKLMPVSKVILISSIKTKHEKPLFFRAAASLRLNRILPMKSYSFLTPLQNYNLGIESEDEKRLAAEYRRNLDPVYTDWAIDRILNWENEFVPPHTVHIHGSEDRIFPLRYTEPTNVIQGGHHLMVMNRAQEISEILKGIV